MNTNPYTVLGLKPGVSDEALKRRYRALLMRTHPDLNPNDPGARAKTEAVIGAYQQLSDPVQRAAIDVELRRAAQAEQARQRQAADAHKARRRRKPSTQKSKAPSASPHRPSKTSSSRAKKHRSRVTQTVTINGETIQFDNNGSIHVVMGNSEVHIQQSVSSGGRTYQPSQYTLDRL